MKLSKTSAQAALALAFLAEQTHSNVVQARQVAQHLGIPTDSALKILQALARHELIHSQLGRAGGYRLRAQPGQVNLLQVIEAIDGPVSGQMRLEEAPDHAAASLELLQSICDRAAQHIREQLSRTTIADLLRRKPVAMPALAAAN